MNIIENATEAERQELIKTLDGLKARYGIKEIIDAFGPVVTPNLIDYIARTARKNGLALVKRTNNLTPKGIDRLNDCFKTMPLVYENDPESIKGLLSVLPQNPIDIVAGRIVTSEPSVYSLQVIEIDEVLEPLRKELTWLNDGLKRYDDKSRLGRWVLKSFYDKDLALREALERRIGKLELLRAHFNALAEIESEHDMNRVSRTRKLARELRHNTRLGKDLSVEPDLDAVLERHSLNYKRGKKA